MPGPFVYDRVKESSTTTGTGDISLAGATTGYRSFVSTVGTGNTTYYAMVNPLVGEWEVGYGTLTSSTILQRTTVLASSNSGSATNFSSGTKDVFITDPASQIYLASLSPRTRLTANVTNSTTTLTNLADLTVSLYAGQNYGGRLVVKCNNSTAAEGIKFDFNGGSATMTNFWTTAAIATGGSSVLVNGLATSLSTVLNYSTITGETVIEFNLAFTCATAGTLIPRFAENTTSTGTATAELGSFLSIGNTQN